MKLKVFTKKQWRKYQAKQAKKAEAVADQAYRDGKREGVKWADDALVATLWQEIVKTDPPAGSRRVYTPKELLGTIGYETGWGDAPHTIRVELFRKELLPDEMLPGPRDLTEHHRG
jgi:hypothetical protein